MSDYVWVSTAIGDSMLIMSVETDIAQADEDAAIEGSRLAKDGKPVPAELCPKRIWGSKDAEQHEELALKPMPHLFFARGQWIVSSQAADILSRFDLGGGALYPVSEGVWQKDLITQVPGDYFVWIFGNVKNGFLPEQSRNQREPKVAGLWWSMPQHQNDDDVAVSRSVTGAPDVWRDKMLFFSLFLSGPLGDAIHAAGFSKAFRLSRCRVI